MHPHDVQQEKICLLITDSNELCHQSLITSFDGAETVIRMERQTYIEETDKLLIIFEPGVICCQGCVRLIIVIHDAAV